MSIFLTLAVDETAGLAMCFAMQEPMKEDQEPNTEENVVDENTSDNVEVISEEAPEAEGSAEPVVELDPWEQLEQDVAKWKDQAIRTAARSGGRWSIGKRVHI